MDAKQYEKLPAFPQPMWAIRNAGFEAGYDVLEHRPQSQGLTKLEYFAGLAMQGILADPTRSASSVAIIQSSVLLARALCAELAKEA